LPSGAVKSAARTLQILELLADLRRPASVVEVAETLRYPQSSTSALMHTLLTLGYVNVEREPRRYSLSSKVMMLGLSTKGDSYEGAVHRLMVEVAGKSGASTVLATRHGAYAQYIDVSHAQALRLHLTLGAFMPISAPATGLSLLSTYSDEEVWRIVSPLYGGDSLPEHVVPLDELNGVIAESRRNGFAYKEALVPFGTAALAVALPVRDGGRPLSIGVVGSAAFVRRRKGALVRLLHDEISRHLGEAAPRA